MKGERMIDRYVDAVREYRALERAAGDDGMTPERQRAIKAARDRASEHSRCLTGGMLGEAKRRLTPCTNTK